jgi:small-conductance mechanosensitive channel
VLSVANRNISKIRKLNHLVDVDLPLSYDLSGREALSLLGGICEKIKALDGIEDCELKGTQDFGASAIMYKIRFYCEPHDRPDIRRSVIMTIQDGLEAAGIRIPYQQIDIHEK